MSTRYSLNSNFFKKGFSLIELVTVAAVMVIISVVVITNLFSRRSKTDLDLTTRKIAATLREAQSRSAAQEGGTIWGVHFDNAASVPFYALFKTAYSSANAVGSYRLPPSICFATSSVAQGSTLDVTFAQVSGLPSTSTSITLNLVSGSCPSGAGETQSSVIRTTSGKIFFDDFNRPNL